MKRRCLITVDLQSQLACPFLPNLHRLIYNQVVALDGDTCFHLTPESSRLEQQFYVNSSPSKHLGRAIPS
jgi:hypothetical protein